MFMRHDKKEATPSLEELQKKRLALQKELDSALDTLGLDRPSLDELLADPSRFAGADWLSIKRELDEFKKTLDLICFNQEEDQLKQRREELRELSRWLQSK